jgi:hypothetical protein
MPKVTEIDLLKTNQPQKDQGKAIVPIPTDIETPTFQHKNLGFPLHQWVYHTAGSEYAYVVCRYKNKQGEKVDLPWTYREYKDGRRDWDTLSIPVPRILFNLHHFTQYPEKPVLVSEGEKAAEAASKLFPDWISTTSSNGSGSAKSSDWSPCKGRRVVIWPDNDDAGFSHAKDVARLCLKAGAASVRIVQIPEEFLEKWDLADELPDGMDGADVQKLIDEAEEVVDPLDGLLERCEVDKGAPFQEDVLEALTDLKATDKAAFQKLRHELKKAGIRVRDLDNELRQSSVHIGDDITELDQLLLLAFEAMLFHSPDGTAYAHIPIKDHYETWPVRSKGFKKWLTRQYFKETGSAPSAEAFNAALNTIEAVAHYEGEEREVFLRVAGLDDKSYVDLCNSEGEVVEIDKDGWRVIKDAPVHFRRTEGMLPLPYPKPNGSIDDLRPFLNVKSETDFILSVSWLAAAFRHIGPFPLLGIIGEQGTAKSSFSRTLKNIVDPNKAPLRRLRTDERDLFISANNSHVLAFDNISKIPASVSDALCCLATGGGFSARQLYTDLDETIFNVMRPIILNGISDVIVRPDLADRSIILTLEKITSKKRRAEKELKAEFAEKLPGILGALFDVISIGLKKLSETKLEGLPRMADFALWGTACETAFCDKPGAFMAAYNANRMSAIEDVLDASPIAMALREFIDKRYGWTGTASDLLNILVEQKPTHDKSWPDTPRGLAAELTRLAPFLREVGIQLETGERAKDKNRTRLMNIINMNNAKKQPSEPSRSSEDADWADGMD